MFVPINRFRNIRNLRRNDARMRNNVNNATKESTKTKNMIDDCGNAILRCSAPHSHHDNTFLIY